MSRERTFRTEVYESRREMRRMKKRRNEKLMIGFVALIVISFALVLELSRGYSAMQDVKGFASRIDRETPDEVKVEVRHFSQKLGDRNPLVRNAAMMAMKLATGWRLGSEPREWRQFWLEHETNWVYHPETSAPPAETKAPWADLLPAAQPK